MNDRERTKQESVKLPLTTIEFIDALRELGMFGNTKASVIRHFVMKGLEQIMADEIIQKATAAKAAMKKKEQES